MKKTLLVFVSFCLFMLSTQAQSAYFTSDSPRCVGDSVHFTPGPPGGTILMEEWDFGDGTITTFVPPAIFPVYAVHAYASTGAYSVTRTVKFSTGIVPYTIQVTINANPVANFTASESCLGSLTQFTNLSVPNAGAIISNTWDFGDGTTSNMPSPVHFYLSYGTYMVTLTVVNSNGCTNTISKPVSVIPNPVANFAFPAVNCMGSPVNFTDLSYPIAGPSSYIVHWLWDFGDGTPPLSVNFPSNPNVQHLFAGSATTYIVRLTVTTTDGCSSYVEKPVTLTPVPIANFTQTGPACEFQAVQFSDLSTSNWGPLVSWNWNFGDPGSGINNTSSLGNPTHVFTAAGMYTVMLVVVNSSGCADTILKAVPVSPHPVANFTADTVYQGTATTFTDLSFPGSGSIATWFWDFGDGQTSTLSNPVHLYATYGVFQVQLTVTNIYGCSWNTIKPVLVLYNPAIGPPSTRTLTNIIVGSGQTKCYNATQLITVAGNGTLFFVLAGGSATFISGQTISYLPGTTIQNGGSIWGYIAPAGPWCLVPSMPAVSAPAVEARVGITGPSFSLYPNPTPGNFILEPTGVPAVEKIYLEIIGLTGEKVFSASLSGESRYELSLSGRPAGLYFLRVISGSRSETAKIIKQE